MTHTPGPWTVSDRKSFDGEPMVYGAGEVICYCPTSADTDPEANARLIAAAPAMLEALELATKELNAIRARDGAPQHIDWHRGQPMQTDSCTHEWWNELTEKCSAAIALATGEEG